MSFQPEIDFPADQKTAVYLQRKENRERAESNCYKLLKFWQTTNRHISKYDAMQMGIDCLAQRVANLVKAGVPVESETRRDLKEPFARYYIKCTCGDTPCYLHDTNLKVG